MFRVGGAMAKRKGSGFGVILVGLLVFGFVGQFFKSDERPIPVESRPATQQPAPSIPATQVPAAPQPTEYEPTTLYTTAGTLNVRSAPSTSSTVLAKLSQGTELRSISVEGEWIRVSTQGGVQGWVHGNYVAASRPVQVAAPQPPPPPVQTLLGPSRDDIVQALIERSIRNYSGNCPCPYNRTASGRRCGGNSAYSKPGGASPLCFPGDVTQAMIDAFRP